MSAGSDSPVGDSNRTNFPAFACPRMDETKRRRLAAIWVTFAFAMGYVTLADGFTADLGDAIGLLAVLLGVGLAYLYYANPGEVLSFEEE